MNTSVKPVPRSNYYYLYLSTLSILNPPVSSSNLNNVTFNVNWDTLFGSLGNATPNNLFVSARLITTSSTVLTWNANKGSVRCNLSSPFGNSSFGMNLGSIVPQQDPTFYPPTNPPSTFLILDTTQNTTSQEVIRPYGVSQLNIQILDKTEALMSNITDWELYLYFFSSKEMFP